MPLCTNCGAKISEGSRFCSMCGERLQTWNDAGHSRPERTRKKINRRYNFAMSAIMVTLAVLGALPIFPRIGIEYSGERVYVPFWDSTGALVGFLVACAGLTMLATKHSEKSLQVYHTMLVVGILLSLALGIKFLSN